MYTHIFCLELTNLVYGSEQLLHIYWWVSNYLLGKPLVDSYVFYLLTLLKVAKSALSAEVIEHYIFTFNTVVQ